MPVDGEQAVARGGVGEQGVLPPRVRVVEVPLLPEGALPPGGCSALAEEPGRRQDAVDERQEGGVALRLQVVPVLTATRPRV